MMRSDLRLAPSGRHRTVSRVSGCARWERVHLWSLTSRPPQGYASSPYLFHMIDQCSMRPPATQVGITLASVVGAGKKWA